MFNASDLASARQDQTSILLDLCDISRMTGSPRTLQTVYSALPCSITESQARGGAGEQVEIDMGVQVYILTVPWDTVVLEDDQVIHNGHTYQVKAYLDDRTPLLRQQAKITRVSG